VASASTLPKVLRCAVGISCAILAVKGEGHRGGNGRASNRGRHKGEGFVRLAGWLAVSVFALRGLATACTAVRCNAPPRSSGGTDNDHHHDDHHVCAAANPSQSSG
jgi:hypothetical protein